MLLPPSLTRTPHKAVVAALTTFAIAGFGATVYFVEHSRGAPVAVADRERQEDDIAETVFRYQFAHNASGRQQTAKVYFLSLRGRNPGDEFMRRFEGHIPVVSRVSECSEDEDIRDIHSDAPGVLFRITKIRWITPVRVEVSGGYEEGYLSSSGNTYYVEKKDGRWVALRDEMHWIS